MADEHCRMLRVVLVICLLLISGSEPRISPASSSSAVSKLRLKTSGSGRTDSIVTDSQPTQQWHKHPDQAGGSDLSASIHNATNTDNDTNGATLSPADYERAMNLPVDEGKVPDIELEYDTWDDIILPPASAVARNAIQNADDRWPGGEVPYTISSGFSTVDRATIASGMMFLERSTCVRFRARNATDADYVRIARGLDCLSPVGRQRTGGQGLFLHDSCLSPGLVAHELMHTIGFWHEHNRPDRDQYVRINYDNIQCNKLDSFRKLTWREVKNLSQPYDIGSIMHYGPYEFARDHSRPTITALVNTSADMGQSRHLTATDVKKVNRLYECDEGLTQCTDRNVHCSHWADTGECEANPRYMHQHCALSCSTCSDQLNCVDKNDHCDAWVASGECDNNPEYMKVHCKKACHLCLGGETEAESSNRNQ